MTNRQAITAVSTLGVCICQQIRQIYNDKTHSMQDIYEEIKAVEDALLRLGKKAGSAMRKDQALIVADRFNDFTQSLAEVK